jgi:hypothetical protein
LAVVEYLLVNKYLLSNYYKKQLVMMLFDHYKMDNNMMVDMMNMDQYKNQIKMMKKNHVQDKMVDNSRVLMMNNMNP